MSSYWWKIIVIKYLIVVFKFFCEKGEDVEIIKIEGFVEIVLVFGFVDVIIDIVEIGFILKENGLFIYEKMYLIFVCLIVNKVFLK